MRSFLASLRCRLILLVLLALVPAFGVIIYQAHIQRSYVQERVPEQALALALQVSRATSDNIRESRPLLAALSQLFTTLGTPLENMNSEACGKFLADLRPEGSTYANLGIIDQEGFLVCSALPYSESLNLADRAYLQGALVTQDFFIGDFQIGRITGRATINTAMPLRSPSGEITGVVYAALDLEALNRLTGDLPLPSGSTITAVDRNGQVLMRHPDQEGWVGQSYPQAPVVQQALAATAAGAARAPGLDSVDRLYGFAPLVESQGADSPMVFVGIPAAVAFAEVDWALRRNLAIMAFAGLLALGATWVAGDLFILRRIKFLVGAAERLAAGDLSARSGVTRGSGEINQLARAFDEMAGALEARLREVHDSQDMLRKLVEEEAVIAEIGRVISSSVDINEVYPSFAEATRALIPWDRIFISLVDVGSGAFVSTYSQGVPMPGRKLGDVSPLSGSVTQEVISARAGLLVQNHNADEILRKFPSLTLGAQIGLRSFISVPLLANDEVIGALHLRSFDPCAYTDRHLKLAERVGTQIAGAIAVAQLYQLRKQGEEDLRQAEQALQQRADDLTRSNAELEQFAYIASHDLQEPLRSITGFTGLLERRYRGQLGEEADRFINRITEATARMQRLINDLLAYSRVGREIALEPTDSRRLVEQEIATMQASIQRSGALVTAGALPTVTADPTLLAQVFRNLIGNAIKFRSEALPTIHISAELRGDYCVFAVRDNGIGIDNEYAERIFTIFQRLHSMEEYPGTGIGLSVCKKAVEAWGGRIWVESETGAGATFYFTAPLAPNPKAQPPAADTPASEQTRDAPAVPLGRASRTWEEI